METQRYANIVPAGVQHVSDRDITVNGITIPAFTLIQVMKTQRVNQVEFHLWQGRGSLTEQDRDTFLKLTLFKCVLMRIGGGGMQAFTYTVPNWRRLSLLYELVNNVVLVVTAAAYRDTEGRLLG